MSKRNILKHSPAMTFNFVPAQYKALSEIMGNVAVAWFATGIISPVFIGINDPFKLTLFLLIGLFASGFFAWLSVVLARGASNE